MRAGEARRCGRAGRPGWRSVGNLGPRACRRAFGLSTGSAGSNGRLMPIGRGPFTVELWSFGPAVACSNGRRHSPPKNRPKGVSAFYGFADCWMA